jgi:hypothetical protein
LSQISHDEFSWMKSVFSVSWNETQASPFHCWVVACFVGPEGHKRDKTILRLECFYHIFFCSAPTMALTYGFWTDIWGHLLGDRVADDICCLKSILFCILQCNKITILSGNFRPFFS